MSIFIIEIVIILLSIIIVLIERSHQISKTAGNITNYNSVTAI